MLELDNRVLECFDVSSFHDDIGTHRFQAYSQFKMHFPPIMLSILISSTMTYQTIKPAIAFTPQIRHHIKKICIQLQERLYTILASFCPHDDGPTAHLASIALLNY